MIRDLGRTEMHVRSCSVQGRMLPDTYRAVAHGVSSTGQFCPVSVEELEEISTVRASRR